MSHPAKSLGLMRFFSQPVDVADQAPQNPQQFAKLAPLGNRGRRVPPMCRLAPSLPPCIWQWRALRIAGALHGYPVVRGGVLIAGAPSATRLCRT